jgi:F0F1-type ATP synthase assembly protein I
MKGRYSGLLLAIVAAVVLWYILSRMHFVILVPVPWWMFLLLILGVILALYLALDHLINRTR